ncbi:MAG: hypothetical protein JXB14_05375 [Candidatus Altiarchaeota archaeon]|nr:hypothetical protein [Candidatus Altiarchaeota archaeon]
MEATKIVVLFVFLVVIILAYFLLQPSPDRGDRWCGTISGTISHALGTSQIAGTWEGLVKDNYLDATWDITASGLAANGVLEGQWSGKDVTVRFSGKIAGREFSGEWGGQVDADRIDGTWEASGQGISGGGTWSGGVC